MPTGAPDPASLTADDLEAYRPQLRLHCHRMLASAGEAEDAVQETLIRAWRAAGRFEGRASVRNWLYRIATNVCLDQLERRKREGRFLAPAEAIMADLDQDRSSQRSSSQDQSEPRAADPHPDEGAMLRQAVRLAFVAALQHLPPKQRAALLLIEVLGWSAEETAAALDQSVAAVNSSLQRARVTLHKGNFDSSSNPAPPHLTDAQAALLEDYLEAFARGDADRFASLLEEDALPDPPASLWLQEPEAVQRWLNGHHRRLASFAQRLKKNQ